MESLPSRRAVERRSAGLRPSVKTIRSPSRETRAVRVENVDSAGALRAEAERVGAVDRDVHATIEVERAVDCVVGLQIDAVAVGATGVIENCDVAAEGER